MRSVADLCCGIGGDAIALARAGIRVLAVDRDPLTAQAARANADALGLAGLVEVREADVTEVDTASYDAVFVDPARRGGRGRIFDPEAYSPPLSWAVQAARKAPHAALKVAPGIPHDAVPAEAEAEWVSDGGDVKEAVLWFGTEPGAVRATLLPGPRTLLSRGLPDPQVRPVGRYLYEPDGAVIRAHLVAEVAEQLDGGLIDATIAYVTADDVALDPVRDRLRDHRRTPLQPEEAEGAAAGAGGRRPDREEAGVGSRAGGAAPEGQAAGAELGDRVPDPGRGRPDDAPRAPRLTGAQGRLGRPPQQQLPFSFVPRQLRRPYELRPRLLPAPQPQQQVPAHARQQVVVTQGGSDGEGVDDLQGRRRAVRHRHGDRAVQFDDRGGGAGGEQAVQVAILGQSVSS